MLVKGRFALRMRRMWGDLRKLIDARVVHNNMNGQPFTDVYTVQFMLTIAYGMKFLHKRNITLRDLKAAKVPLWRNRELRYAKYDCCVADYECSVGVMGTGFWRAPEMLLAVKNGNVTPALFSTAADVYSYGMTCFEILTGRIPFKVEGFKLNEYDRVIEGYRPSLPRQTLGWMKNLLNRCGHTDPSKRPTFRETLNSF